MVRDIVKLGTPILRQVARPVESITPEVRTLVADMVSTMYAARGIGLAAPQIGVPLRVFVLDASAGRDPSALRVCINPTWARRDGMQLQEEGCLSVPGFVATVARPQSAAVCALDLEGREHVVEGTDLVARALQHEMDHLDGLVFVDRLRGLNRTMIVRKIRKLERAGRW